MNKQLHEQISLFAEDEDAGDYCDWEIDTDSSPEAYDAIVKVCDWMRGQPNGSIIDTPDVKHLLDNLQPPILQEHFKSLPNSALHDGGQIKNSPPNEARHDGGQPQTRILSMEGNGEQIKNRPLDSALHHGGQIKNSIFDRDRGDDGTWIEKQDRKTGTFEYLRWRDLSGIKRAKYLGKVV